MTPVSILTNARRRRLLLGSAMAALTASLPTSALAAPPEAAGIDAVAAMAVVNDQTQDDSEVTATAANPVAEISAQPNNARTELSGNVISSAARANKSLTSMTPESLDLHGAAGGASIFTGAAGTEASAPALIATRQSTDATLVSAHTANSQIAMHLVDPVQSRADIAGNTQEAVALANDASALLALSGASAGVGAGVVTDQSITDGLVAASMEGETRLNLSDSTHSDFALGANLQRAIGYGNSGVSSLAVDAVALESASGSAFQPIVEPDAQNPSVSAAYAVVSDQRGASDVKARAAGGFLVNTENSFVDSSVTNNANNLVAAGYGNQSANDLALSANAIDAQYWSSAVGNVTNVQKTADTEVGALSDGGARVGIDGDAVGASIAISGNAGRALAVGNLADENRLAASGISIIAGDAGSGGEGPIGTAQFEWDGAMTVTAPFSVQNAQLNEALVFSSARNSSSVLDVGGAIVGSDVEASDNSSSSSAAGNQGVNSLALDGTLIATAADLNSLQVSKGPVKARVGQFDAPAGATIRAGGEVVAASLSVTGNEIYGEAAANRVANSLTIDGDFLANNSGHMDALAGLLDFGTGASADYALANHQRVEGADPVFEIEGVGPDPLPITSSVHGQFAAEAGDGAVGSALKVADNHQSSSVLGSGASNSIAVTANALGNEDGVAPGSALWSNQSAYADMMAASSMTLGLAPDAVDSSLRLSDNSNIAEARMNDVSNSLSIQAVSAGTLSDLPAEAFGYQSSMGEAIGDHVLASNQFAEGDIRGFARTEARGLAPDAQLVGSNYVAIGNETLAQATANTAHNGVSLDVASNLEAAAALSNMQLSFASVSAAASTRLGYGGDTVADSQALIDGNSTSAYAGGNDASNSLTVDGMSNGTQSSIARITTGALNAVTAPAVLKNVQVNGGPISARSYAPTYALNLGGGGVSESRLALTGNSVAATAYGNNAVNTAFVGSSDRVPGAALANVQTNFGPVSARVVGAANVIAPGSINAGRITISGNAVSASAVGNAATNTIRTSY